MRYPNVAKVPPLVLMMMVVAVATMVGCTTVREENSAFGFRESTSGQSRISFDGLVRWVEYGGGRETSHGFWRLMADGGGVYDPVSIPAEFQRNGLRVAAVVTPLPLMESGRSGQYPVYIQSIQALD